MWRVVEIVRVREIEDAALLAPKEEGLGGHDPSNADGLWKPGKIRKRLLHNLQKRSVSITNMKKTSHL